MDGLISRMERKKQEARERILDAAQRLFVVDRRYERVTIREIADLADVSVGAVYLHFRTKGDILAELLSLQVNRLTGTVFARVATAHTGIGKLDMLLASVREVRRDPALAVFALIPMLEFGGKVDERIDTLIRAQLGLMVEVVTQTLLLGKVDGSLRADGDCAFRASVFTRTLTAVLGGMILEPVRLETTNIGGFDEEAVFSGFLDLLRDALIAPGGRRLGAENA